MTLQELLDLEHEGWQSLCDGTGSDYYGRLMTDDALMILSNGQVLTRREAIESLNDAPPWDSYEIDGARLIELGGVSALLVYRGTGIRDDLAKPFVALMSSVYTREAGGWALASYQQTPIPD